MAFNKIRNAVIIAKQHLSAIYPRTDEDAEAIATWISPKCVKMRFKAMTPDEGYNKTVKKFKILFRYGVKVTREDDLTVVSFP